MSKIIQEVLSSGTSYLEERQIDEARHSMQSLLMHVLGCDKTWLYLHYQDPIDEQKLAPLRDLLRKRGQGVPLQHLLGSVEFYRRDFTSDSRALIPRPETEELVEMAIHRCEKKAGMRILDMGTGSGIIGITLALELAAYKPTVVMADISEAALSLALQNATALAAPVKTYRSDLFSLWQDENPESSAVTPPHDFDLVLANLPYVPEGEEGSVELSHDPATALYGGEDGLDIVRRFLKEALPYLASHALVMLEVGHDQGHAVASLMQELAYTDCTVLADMCGKERFPMGYAPQKVAPEAPHEQEESEEA
ncbi:MAG: peptide chain release factor N(5)-glutamine methyltransferase [Akkermansia sp.]